MAEQRLAVVYYPKTQGIQVNREKRQMTLAQKNALKAARDAMRAEYPVLFGDDDKCPLDGIAAGVAAYLDARKEELGERKGNAVRFALEDEILDLREE